jgi:hypothetical protein
MKTRLSKKMKTQILILLILLTPLTTALEFYPSSFDITLQPGQQTCRTVFFELDAPAKINDEWGSSPTTPWSVVGFNTPASEHEIQISYPEEISQDDTQAQFCIFGTDPGEYRGALVFRQNQVGTSVVQFAVWIKLTITDSEQPPQSDPTDDDQTSQDDNSDDDKDDDDDRDSSRGRSDISQQISNNPQETQQLSYNPPTQPEDTTLKSPRVENNSQTILILSTSTTILAAVFLIVLLIARKPSKEETKKK